MVDLQETPAVPPWDSGGDDRVGQIAAGAILVVLGWGLAVVLNIGLHLTAPAGGTALGPVRIFTTWGLAAEIAVGVGLLTGLLGAAMIYVGRDLPRGPLVLPGEPY